MQKHPTVAEAPSGQQLIGESRFGTHDIRLSSALCALGFALKIDAQPCTVTIDADKEKRIITFFHEGTTKLGDFTANHVDLWWNSPKGKFTIEGYDDALTAMKRVHVERGRMIDLSKRGPRYEPGRKVSVATSSLHTASCLAACEIECLGYDPTGKQWVFSQGAEIIWEQIKKGGKPKERPLANDLCIDWMLESLRYRDWLAKLVRDPDCIPVIEMRDGEKVLMISQGMPEREQREWVARL